MLSLNDVVIQQRMKLFHKPIDWPHKGPLAVGLVRKVGVSAFEYFIAVIWPKRLA